MISAAVRREGKGERLAIGGSFFRGLEWGGVPTTERKLLRRGRTDQLPNSGMSSDQGEGSAYRENTAEKGKRRLAPSKAKKEG